MTLWRARFLAILAVLCLVAVGCGGGDTDTPTGGTDGSEPSTPSGEPQDISIVADDYRYTDAPAELEAGVVNLSFDNQGTAAHEVSLAGIGDTPIDQFAAEFGPVLQGGPFPTYIDQVAAPIQVPGGESADVTFTVSEGTYVMFCALTGVAKGEQAEKPKKPHYALGMIQPVTVAGGDAAEPQLPEADGTITASDYTFEADLEAGDTDVNFVNDGPDEIHFATISLYPEGTDATAAEEAFKATLEADPNAPPPKDIPRPESVGFSGIFSPGLGSSFRLEGGFESGRTYLFACFISDRAGGPPHAIAYDMYRAVTIG